jgi:predicted RNase H-like nuclease (RuvC/YqgF family)
VQQSEEYAAQLLSKCKEVEMREEECRGLRKSLEGSKKEMDECITRLLAMSQELTIVGDHSSPINIPNVETDSRPLS